jgi:4-amino-4-deoxy-L-arabinose transferase-like glycosyltransferase
MTKSLALEERRPRDAHADPERASPGGAIRPHLYLVREAVQTLALSDRLLLVGAVGAGAFLRLWDINGLGLNTDETVYAGQAAGIVNDEALKPFFPVFRAHPMLFQFVISLGFLNGVTDWVGRVFAAIIGIATLYLVYQLAALLYGRQAAVFATLFMAVMPYHVIVTRQIILDGPMTFCATLTLYLLARYATSHRPEWLYAAGAGVGLTFLTKETGIIIVGGVYAFLALSSEIRLRIRDLFLSLACMGVVMAAFPLAINLAGGTKSAQNYFIWQLFRRPNHEWSFYPTTVSMAIGPLIILLALVGLWLLRREGTWREKLLLAWIMVPVGFFQLWPTKGFQYLLPVAPAVAILAARTLARWQPTLPTFPAALRRPAWLTLPPALRWPAWAARLGRWRPTGHTVRLVVVALVALTLLVPSWNQVQKVITTTFLAGTGGVPGGREAGYWIKDNIPAGAKLLTIGPSMANVLQFYGHRKAYGLAVSPNPLRRNPSYDPVPNPDLQFNSGELHYVVWDAFSATRSPLFAEKLLIYAERFNGRVVHTQSVTTTTPEGAESTVPIIVIYEVHP